VNISPDLFANITLAEKLGKDKQSGLFCHSTSDGEKKSFIRKRLAVKVTFVFLIRLQQFSKETVGNY
jgi:hypothetical protein